MRMDLRGQEIFESFEIDLRTSCDVLLRVVIIETQHVYLEYFI